MSPLSVPELRVLSRQGKAMGTQAAFWSLEEQIETRQSQAACVVRAGLQENTTLCEDVREGDAFPCLLFFWNMHYLSI